MHVPYLSRAKPSLGSQLYLTTIKGVSRGNYDVHFVVYFDAVTVSFSKGSSVSAKKIFVNSDTRQLKVSYEIGRKKCQEDWKEKTLK